MASQNPSSVPVVLPNALSPVANYVNNDTSSWVPGVQAIETSNTFAGTSTTPAVPANATASPVASLNIGGPGIGSTIPFGSIVTVSVLSRSVKDGGVPQANAYVYMTADFIPITGGLVNVLNATSTDASFSINATGGNTVAVYSGANNTKSLQYVSVLTQVVPITSRLL
jgi:hypothetical protein